MLKLSKKVEYALMAAKFMALQNSGRLSSAREIAESYQIPHPLVAKVLQSLVRSNLAVSVKGVNGGFSLSKKPEQISLLDIIAAVDTKFRIVDCMQPNGSIADCSNFDCCKIKDPLAEIQRKIDKVFIETSLTQIL
jgi:Rrf2 family protein